MRSGLANRTCIAQPGTIVNRIYKTVWSEQAGTFVAVSEISKGRGKRSGSSVSKAAGAIALAGASALVMGNALADVVIPEGENRINFTSPNGRIDFGSGGSIVGLSSLTVAGSVNANQIVVASAATLAAGNMQVVTGGQLHQTNLNVTAAQSAANAANTALGALANNVTTSALNVGAGTFAVANNGISVKAGTTVDMGGNRILNVADGAINPTSRDAVNGRQVYSVFFEQGAGGVRYFHANSTEADSISVGEQSVAIGPRVVSRGTSSIAAGAGAATSDTATGSIALGQSATAGTQAGAQADGAGSIAIGRNSQASGNGTVALGDGARVENERVSDALALGTAARVSGLGSHGAVAVGHEAHAGAVSATALGAGAQALAANASALGAGARASGAGSVAMGRSNATAGNGLAAGTGAYVATADSIALGTGAGVGTESNAAGDRTSHIAIGTGAGQIVAGNQDTSIGFGAGSRVTGDDNIALGTQAGTGITGNNNIAIGVGANADAGARAQSIAIGGRASAGSDSVALGDGATAFGNETLALGKDAQAQANGVALGAHASAQGNSVALGRNSSAASTDALGTGYLTGAAAPGSVVSVGNTATGQLRRIVNVADGSQTHDAVNVGQLRASQQSVANLVGGSVTLDANGTYGGHVIELTDTGGTAHRYTSVAAAINAVSSGAINVLPGNAVVYNPNGTLTVAAGNVGSDAVNMNQLNEAIAQSGVKYFSVNTSVDANDDNDGATGVNAMAIGPAAVAGGDASIAIGHTATVNTGATEAVAIGHNVSARAQNATTLGSSSHTYDQSGVAIGHQAVSRGQNSIVMGTGAEADPKSNSTVDNAIVIGTQAEATADNGIAVGESALASELRAVAQGFDAHATAADAVAMGTRARASGASALASGTDAAASGVNAQASGTRASATGTDAIATGTNTNSYATNGIALGTGATSGLASPLPEEAGRNRNAIAIGQGALADYGNALAMGAEARARAQSAMALGDNATASGIDALAVGTGARATAQSASALGDGAQALHAGSVALGRDAITAGPVATGSSTIDKVTYTYAGTAPVATVSLGDVGSERTLTNVAAGRVSASSTDAINGSQLFQTNTAVTALGNNLDTAGASVASALGGTSSYNPDTHRVTAGLNVRGNGYSTVQDALNYVGQGWNVSAQGGVSANVAPGAAVDLSNADSNIQISRNGTNLVFDLADDVTVGSLTAGGTVVDTTGVAAGDNVHLGNTGLVIQGGPSVTLGGINAGTLRVTNVAPGVAGTDAVNVDQLNTVATNPLTFAGDAGVNVKRQLGETVNLVGGASAASLTDGNIGVVANGTDTLAIRLNKDVDLGQSGSVAIGNSRVDNTGLTVDDRTGSATKVGAGTITVMANPTTGPANTVVINANTGTIGGLTNKTFNPNAFTSGQAATEDQLKSVNDIATAGWTVTDVAGNGANVGPNGQVRFEGDRNLAVDQTGTNGAGVVEIALKEAIDLGQAGSVSIGDTVLSNSGLTVNDGAGQMTTTTAAGTTVTGPAGSTTVGAGMLTIGGGANTIVVNGGAGTIGGLSNKTFDPNGFTSGQAATEDQLKSVSDTVNAGWTVTDAGGNDARIGPNGRVTFEGDSNLTVAQTGADGAGIVGIKLNESIDLGAQGSVAMGDTLVNNAGLRVVDADGNVTTTSAIGTVVTGAAGSTTLAAGLLTVAGGSNAVVINGGTGTVGGLTNKTFNPEAFTSGQAATEDQLRSVSDIANTGWNVSVGGEGATASGKVGPGRTVDFSNTDGNIGISRDGTDLVFNLADNLVVANSVTVGNTVMDNNGIRVRNDQGADLVTLNNLGLLIAGGPSVTSAGISAGGKQITNVAAGTEATDAVNVSQLKDVQQNVDNLGDRAVKYDGNVGDPKNTITLEGDGGTTLTNLADGRIEAGSKDAVNGGQIHDMGSSIADGMGGNSKFENGKLVTELNVGGHTYNNVNDALSGVHGNLSEHIGNVEAIAGAGWHVTDANGNTSNIGPNGKVAFVGDSNISVQQTGQDNQGRIEVKLNDNIAVQSITAVKIDAQTVNANTVVINNGGPVISETGIDMSGKRMTNVADGVETGDAVNVGQLGRVAGNLQGQVNDLRGDLRRQDRKLSAGVAAAMATASLPQAYLPGKTMMSMAAGTWNSESGMAIGFSGVSDNGKWVYKLSGNSTSRGDYGGAVGVGYQW